MTKTTTLDNGLRIVTQNMPGLETVAMGIWNSVGGRDELKKVKWRGTFFGTHGL